MVIAVSVTGLLDTVFDLPTHVLVVHAAVVFIPLAGLAALVLAAVPRWRRPLRWWVLAVTVIATGLVPVATDSGQRLRTTLGQSGALTSANEALVTQHANRGEQMKWFVIALLVLVALLVWLDSQRPTRSSGPYGSRAIRGRQSLTLRVVALLTALAAIAAVVQVARVGHSGSQAVWQPVLRGSSTSGGQ